jgi:hypothetical protein
MAESKHTRRGALAFRVALTLIGAAGMIGGSFLVWLRRQSLTGVDLNYRIYYRLYFAKNGALRIAPHSRFLTSAAMVTIALGVAALIGLAFRRGWLTSLAGLAAIGAIVLFALTLKRADVVPHLRLRKNLGVGAVVVAGGGVLAFIGGLVGRRRRAPSPAMTLTSEPAPPRSPE